MILFFAFVGRRLHIQPRPDLIFQDVVDIGQGVQNMASALSKMPIIEIDGRPVPQASKILIS